MLSDVKKLLWLNKWHNHDIFHDGLRINVTNLIADVQIEI